MLRSGGGRILYTSPIAGTMPGPFEAVYNTSKASLTSFAQAVRNELKNTNVSITVLMPGSNLPSRSRGFVSLMSAQSKNSVPVAPVNR